MSKPVKKKIGLTKQETLDSNWAEFIEWCAVRPENRTLTMPWRLGGRADEHGYQVSENWDTLPIEDNFWLWYTNHKLNPPKTLLEEELKGDIDES